MTKRYDEAIEVTADSLDGGAPVSFSWRGCRYDVDQRLSSWREAGEWWNGPGRREREFHRVLARPAGLMAIGDVDGDGVMASAGAVFDVYLDRFRGRWCLARVWD